MVAALRCNVNKDTVINLAVGPFDFHGCVVWKRANLLHTGGKGHRRHHQEMASPKSMALLGSGTRPLATYCFSLSADVLFAAELSRSAGCSKKKIPVEDEKGVTISGQHSLTVSLVAIKPTCCFASPVHILDGCICRNAAVRKPHLSMNKMDDLGKA